MWGSGIDIWVGCCDSEESRVTLFRKTGCAFTSIWADPFHLLKGAWKWKVSLTAVLPAAGCASLGSHQIFHELLMSAFLVVLSCIEVADGKVWQAVELACSVWSACTDFWQRSACRALWNHPLRNCCLKGHLCFWNQSGKEKPKQCKRRWRKLLWETVLSQKLKSES